MKYVRFRMDNEVRYGILNGEIIAVLDGDLFGDYVECGKKGRTQRGKAACAVPAQQNHVRRYKLYVPYSRMQRKDESRC